MPVLHQHVARRDTALSPTMVNFLIALVVLFTTIALLTGTLLILRQMRRKQKEADNLQSEADLPIYFEKDEQSSSSSVRASRLVITAASYSEKEALIRGANGPPSPGVPEIRITFPEEVDERGRRMSGRVVVVKVGEHSVGLEPFKQEDLPPYQSREEGGRFESLDLDRMGGLKEKQMW